jgi:hypothetical protein
LDVAWEQVGGLLPPLIIASTLGLRFALSGRTITQWLGRLMLVLAAAWLITYTVLVVTDHQSQAFYGVKVAGKDLIHLHDPPLRSDALHHDNLPLF